MLLLSITCRLSCSTAQRSESAPVTGFRCSYLFSLSIPFINTAAAPEEQVLALYQPLLGNLTSTAEHSYTESFDTCLKTCLWKATKILTHHPDYSSHTTVSLKSAPGNLFNTLSNFSSSQQPISKLSEDPHRKPTYILYLPKDSSHNIHCSCIK